jgi:dienelactone hydrolase
MDLAGLLVSAAARLAAAALPAPGAAAWALARGRGGWARFVAGCCAACAAAAMAPAAAQVPMPPDLRIEAPGPEVPADAARLVGAWGDAAWNGVLPHALVVERVRADGAADVVYATGAPERSGFQAQWRRLTGRVAAGHLALRWPSGAAAEYAMDADGRLVGHYTSPAGGRSWVWLARVPGGDAEAVAAALARPVRALWEELRIPVRSALRETAGRTLLLQAMLYRTAASGRRPLVVLNHGSTDGERPGVRSVAPFEAQARLFLTRGWNAVALMRKGRGRSEGPMLEPSSDAVPEEVQLESALEDLDAAVERMRAEPYVDPARVVVAGVSRGGLLAVAYASRHPGKVAGVLNFVGGWWGERWPSDFNLRQAALAGRGAAPPMLWLYADRDSYYGLPHARAMFRAFRDAGGRGELVEFDDLPGNGHALHGWLDRWEPAVARYLDTVAPER